MCICFFFHCFDNYQVNRQLHEKKQNDKKNTCRVHCFLDDVCANVVTIFFLMLVHFNTYQQVTLGPNWQEIN